MERKKRYLVAADTGGTFTDLAVYDTETGDTRFGKTLTTAKDLVIGALKGLDETGIQVDDASIFIHGTTHVINSLLERRGGRTALVTTSGFRDVLEIGRGNRAEPFNLRYRRDPPLIPRDLRFEVSERIGGKGEIVVSLVEEEIRKLAEELKAQDVQAVAVSLLNSYRNPEHEQRVTALLGKLLPGVFVTCGSDLSRELMEYERTATVAANAFVGARMTGYIGGFTSELQRRGFSGNFYLMGSNGGVMSASAAVNAPVSLVESGPVGAASVSLLMPKPWESTRPWRSTWAGQRPSARSSSALTSMSFTPTTSMAMNVDSPCVRQCWILSRSVWGRVACLDRRKRPHAPGPAQRWFRARPHRIRPGWRGTHGHRCQRGARPHRLAQLHGWSPAA